jgi:hypothetical protein
MPLEDLLTNRLYRWLDLLERYAYDVDAVQLTVDSVAIRARRSTAYGDPPVLLDVVERWIHGSDPGGRGLERDGCVLSAAAWHAQFEGDLPEHAERLDVDPAKTPDLLIHRHPYGRRNDVREPVEVMPPPERWVQEIEQAIADHYAE